MRTVLMAMTFVSLLLVAGCDGGQEANGTATSPPTERAVGSAETEPGQAGGPTTEPTEPTEATPTPTATSTEPDEDSSDDVAVLLDADGRVVVIASQTGEEIRELLDGVRVDDPASNDLAVTPDGEFVFVVVPPDEPPGASQVLRLRLEGGDPEPIAEGTVPAIAPNGETLAYVSYEEGADPVGTPEPVLVLHDLDSGAETRLRREEPFHFIPDVEWTADGQQVVFTAGEIHTGLRDRPPGVEPR